MVAKKNAHSERMDFSSSTKIDNHLSTDYSDSLVYVYFLIFLLSPQKYQTTPQGKIFKILDKEVREEAENRSTMAVFYLHASYSDYGNSKLPLFE